MWAPVTDTQANQTAGSSMCLGQLVAVTSNGTPLVDFPGNPHGPVEASTIVQFDASAVSEQAVPVLLSFPDPDHSQPIILGFVSHQVKALNNSTADPPRNSATAIVDGERLVLTADREIELRCGKSSITLRKDGRVLIKGVDLISRASRTNRIKGGSVAIN